jgi:hypothetical protein
VVPVAAAIDHFERAGDEFRRVADCDADPSIANI